MINAKFVLLSCAILTAALMQAPRNPSSLGEPVREDLMQKVVGSVEGLCCTPGRRWGCDSANNPCNAYNRCGITCSGTWNPACTSATCGYSVAGYTCDYSPQTVGLNTCVFTGSEPCGTATVYEPEPFNCTADGVTTTFPAGNYFASYRCTSKVQTAWDGAGHSSGIASVCVGDYCPYSYSLCEN